MATFMFSCPDCGLMGQVLAPVGVDVYPPRCRCGTTQIRDYRAESVGLTGMVRMRQEREGYADAQAAAILPNREDFMGPKDPDGSKGIRQWNETHEPKVPGVKATRPK